jgi:predicted amidophosphoribosyltransferase
MMYEAYQHDEFYLSKFTGEEIDALLTCVAEQKIQAAICQRCGAPLNSDMKCEYCGTAYRYVLEEAAK